MLLQSIFKISLRRRDHISMGDLFLFFYRGVHYLLGLSGLKVEWVTAAQVITDQITTENLHHLYTMDFWVIQWLQSLKRWKRKRYVISITYTFYTEYLKRWWLHFSKAMAVYYSFRRVWFFQDIVEGLCDKSWISYCWDTFTITVEQLQKICDNSLRSFPNKRLKETELFI